METRVDPVPNVRGNRSNRDRKSDFVSTTPLKTTDGCEANEAYQIRQVRFDQDLGALLPGWKACFERFNDHSIVCDPEWLQQRYKQEGADLLAYLFERDAKVVGAVALEFSRYRLACRLATVKVPNLPLRMLRLVGYTPSVPAEESAHDLLFRRLLDLEFDVMYMTCIRGDSFFWQYVHTSPLIKKHFRFYSPHALWQHPYIRMTGSFDSYMQKFSSKERNNFSRRMRKLHERGEVELVRVTKEADVDSFVEAAEEISRKTYQFRALGIGIRSPDRLKSWLKWAARQGWLRSYLLKCGGAPCAFQVAYQYDGKFLGIEVGYDSAWSRLGVGITQQLLAVEDLFKENKPEICDFGAYAEYKETFGNEAYPDALLWLFRRRPYSLFALHAYRLSMATSKAAGNVLRRANLKSQVRRILRRQ